MPARQKEMNYSLVSVIMPVYHQSEKLNISIPSVLRQSYSNIELIAVNDGSTWEDRMILEKYREQDKRVRIIDKDNGGLVDATSVGIDNAIGEYICFVDPDDEIGIDFISNFIEKIDDCDFVSMGFYFKLGDRISAFELKENRVYNKKDLEEIISVFISESPYYHISNRVFISRWNKMYRTELLRKVVEDYREYKDITLGEDTFFTFFMLKYASKGRTEAEQNSYYYYIDNTYSMMNNLSIDKHIEKSELAFQKLSSILRKNNYSCDQANALFYSEVSNLWNRLPPNSIEHRCELEIRLNQNPTYCECLRQIYKKKKIHYVLSKFYYRFVPLDLHIFIRSCQKNIKANRGKL